MQSCNKHRTAIHKIATSSKRGKKEEFSFAESENCRTVEGKPIKELNIVQYHEDNGLDKQTNIFMVSFSEPLPSDLTPALSPTLQTSMLVSLINIILAFPNRMEES